MKNRLLRTKQLLLGFAASLALGATDVIAEVSGFLLYTNPAVREHFPGPDGLIGTSDDVVMGGSAGPNFSESNNPGSYSYNAFQFNPSSGDLPEFPPGFDAITFVRGTVSVDKNVAANGGGPFVTSLFINSGTEPFPGHGSYSSRVTNVYEGTYDPSTGAFSLIVDLEYIIGGDVFTETTIELTGTAFYQAAEDFGTSTGNDYFENVVKPLAQAEEAPGAVMVSGEGQLRFLGYPIKFAIVGLEGLGLTINAGLNDAWGIEGAPFQGVFITVFEELNGAFFAVFTYDAQPIANTATVGGSDQRFITSFGAIVGNSMTGAAQLTTGGIFNGDNPTASQDGNYGTFTVEFYDCHRGTLFYELPGVPSGEMKLFRFANDNVPLCQERGYESYQGL